MSGLAWDRSIVCYSKAPTQGTGRKEREEDGQEKEREEDGREEGDSLGGCIAGSPRSDDCIR